MPQPNGSAPGAATPAKKTVVGINLGNSYASIAVVNKEGMPDCIANEDGERQIACAVSFHGEEMYIGNQAKPQLVKNASNTIIGFRNLLGKKFSEIPKDQPVISAAVIQHPDGADVAAYKVAVLQPAPSPLPPSNIKSSSNTPAASVLPTPRSEPVPAERILTVREVTSIFIKSLVQSAKDFLGRDIDGAVIAIPSWFDDAARTELEGAANDAGVNVLQLVDEAGVGALPSVVNPVDGLDVDRISLLVDFGQSSTSLYLLSIRHGLVYTINSSHHPDINGEQIDSKIVKHFAAEFKKKTKVPLDVCPSTENQDKRAEAKLRLAIEHTKRTISASPGAATCSVESLKDGIDFTGSINRLRFDLIASSVYTAVVRAALDSLKTADLDPLHVNEIIYIGGSAALPGLDETFLSHGFPEEVVTPFTAGTVIGGGVGDPTTLLARGAAQQAWLLAEAGTEDQRLHDAFQRGSEYASVKSTGKTIGIIIPSGDEASHDGLGGLWVEGVPKETPVPYRRIVQFDCEVPESGEKLVGMELWEVDEGVKIEKTTPPKSENAEGEDAAEEEEEEEEIRSKNMTKDKHLASLCHRVASDTSRTTVRLQVQFVVDQTGSVTLTVSEAST